MSPPTMYEEWADLLHTYKWMAAKLPIIVSDGVHEIHYKILQFLSFCIKYSCCAYMLYSSDVHSQARHIYKVFIFEDGFVGEF